MDEAGMNFIPADLTVEDGGKQVPFRDTAYVKDAPDFPTLLKRGLDSHRVLASGTMLKPPGKDAKDEEKKGFLDKVFSTGLIPRAPEKPDGYQIAIPEKLPAGVSMPDEVVAEFRGVAHKFGLTQDQVNGLMSYEIERLGKMMAPQLAAQAEQEAGFTTNMEALKKDWGANFDANKELVARAGKYIFGTSEEAAKHGFTGDAKFLSKGMLKIAKMLETSDDFMQGGNNVSNVITEARKEIDKIRTDKMHPMYDKFKKGDPEVKKHMDALYQQEDQEIKAANGAAA